MIGKMMIECIDCDDPMYPMIANELGDSKVLDYFDSPIGKYYLLENGEICKVAKFSMLFPVREGYRHLGSDSMEAMKSEFKEQRDKVNDVLTKQASGLNFLLQNNRFKELESQKQKLLVADRFSKITVKNMNNNDFDIETSLNNVIDNVIKEGDDGKTLFSSDFLKGNGINVNSTNAINLLKRFVGYEIVKNLNIKDFSLVLLVKDNEYSLLAYDEGNLATLFCTEKCCYKLYETTKKIFELRELFEKTNPFKLILLQKTFNELTNLTQNVRDEDMILKILEDVFIKLKEIEQS